MSTNVISLALPLALAGLLASILTGCGTQSEEPHHSIQDPALWSYGIDPYGTRAEYGDRIVKDGIAQIAFHRVPRPGPEEHPWIELIYYSPDGHLSGVTEIHLTYQSSEPLLIKLSQSDYGEDGDNSYAHYQATAPAADDWHSVQLVLGDFSRPDWTPMESSDVGLLLENVNAIYLTPYLNDETGGYAELKVKSIDLIRPIAPKSRDAHSMPKLEYPTVASHCAEAEQAKHKNTSPNETFLIIFPSIFC